jgi:anti-sigma-K factor RskA
MSDRSQLGHGNCGVDAAAYALGALEPGEAEAFRRHLATCVVCRDEVATFEELTDAMALAAPEVQLPRRLKRRLISSVRREPRGKRTSTAPSGWRAPLRRPLLAGVALAVAALLAVGIVLSSGESGGGGAGRTRTVEASVATPSGSAVVRVSSGSAELVLRHFPPPPRGKIYEVWLQRGEQTPSPTGALFSVSSSGAGAVEIPGYTHGVDRVLVTPEPAGGSATPTHAPVIVAQLG